MLMLITIVALLIYFGTKASRKKAEEANQEVKKQLGNEYNSNAAGNPKIDGPILLVLAIVCGLIAFACIGGSLGNLP